jgi:hypothetical protein
MRQNLFKLLFVEQVIADDGVERVDDKLERVFDERRLLATRRYSTVSSSPTTTGT